MGSFFDLMSNEEKKYRPTGNREFDEETLGDDEQYEPRVYVTHFVLNG